MSRGRVLLSEVFVVAGDMGALTRTWPDVFKVRERKGQLSVN